MALWGFGVVAVALAFLFAIWVPRGLLGGHRSPAGALIVRWGHSAVWLLLAAWAFLLGAGWDTPLALVAGVGYLLFVVVLISRH